MLKSKKKSRLAGITFTQLSRIVCLILTGKVYNYSVIKEAHMNQFKRAMITVMFAVCLSKGAILPAAATLTQTPLMLPAAAAQSVEDVSSENE